MGETGRNLHQRMTEHKRAVRNSDPNNALAVHVSKSHHNIIWEEAKVVAREQHWTKTYTVTHRFSPVWAMRYARACKLNCQFVFISNLIHVRMYTSPLYNEAYPNLKHMRHISIL